MWAAKRRVRRGAEGRGVKLVAQRFFIYRFKQSWSKLTMNRDGAPNHSEISFSCISCSAALCASANSAFQMSEFPREPVPLLPLLRENWDSPDSPQIVPLPSRVVTCGLPGLSPMEFGKLFLYEFLVSHASGYVLPLKRLPDVLL